MTKNYNKELKELSFDISEPFEKESLVVDINDAEQFITDLRKHDEEELIKRLRAFQTIIKDYYAKQHSNNN